MFVVLLRLREIVMVRSGDTVRWSFLLNFSRYCHWYCHWIPPTNNYQPTKRKLSFFIRRPLEILQKTLIKEWVSVQV